jgi:Bacterial Ig-like domain (group 2)
MHRQLLMLATVAITAASVGACTMKDNNAITGNNGFDSISLSSDPASFTIVEGDSAAITPTVKIEPQDVVISNGADNIVYTFADPAIAEINESGYVQGDAVGSTTLTLTYTDVDHAYTTTSISVPVTVTGAP